MPTHRPKPPQHGASWLVWYVEKPAADGGTKRYARLEGARLSDMFWVDYRVVDLTTNEADRAALFSSDFWHREPAPVFRHVPTGILWEHAFAGGVTPTSAVPS